MSRCQICGSHAINIDKAGLLCDVHFYKVQRDELLGALKDAYPYIDNDPLRLRIGAAITKAGGTA